LGTRVLTRGQIVSAPRIVDLRNVPDPGAGPRRALLRWLAGMAAAAGLVHLGIGLNETEARKKRKKRGKRRRKRTGARQTAPPAGGAAPPPPISPPPPVCDETICEGQCVNLDLDPNNCGECGNTCSELFFCCGGQCRSRLNDDELNCGACGRVCTGDKPRCCRGRCIGRTEVCG
jgi:hypothetical protein